MRRIILLALLSALATAGVPKAWANGAYGKYLPPGQAFRLDASVGAHAVALDWRIANGYFLYREKFKIVATSGVIGTPRFPAGKVEDDPNFGRVEIYQHEVRVTVPYKEVPLDNELSLLVTYEGCIPNGICYPPITKSLELRVKSAK